MNKKISLGIAVAACLTAAAVAFSAAFMISRSIFNSKLQDLSQKQDMFSKLSDVDSLVRQHYSGEIDEDKLHEALMEAYSKALDYSVLFMSAEEYSDGNYEEKGCTYRVLSDGTYMVIVSSPEQTTAKPESQE